MKNKLPLHTTLLINAQSLRGKEDALLSAATWIPGGLFAGVY
jgi:hypothetical protein